MIHKMRFFRFLYLFHFLFLGSFGWETGISLSLPIKPSCEPFDYTFEEKAQNTHNLTGTIPDSTKKPKINEARHRANINSSPNTELFHQELDSPNESQEASKSSNDPTLPGSAPPEPQDPALEYFSPFPFPLPSFKPSHLFFLSVPPSQVPNPNHYPRQPSSTWKPPILIPSWTQRALA